MQTIVSKWVFRKQHENYHVSLVNLYNARLNVGKCRLARMFAHEKYLCGLSMYFELVQVNVNEVFMKCIQGRYSVIENECLHDSIQSSWIFLRNLQICSLIRFETVDACTFNTLNEASTKQLCLWYSVVIALDCWFNVAFIWVLKINFNMRICTVEMNTNSHMLSVQRRQNFIFMCTHTKKECKRNENIQVNYVFFQRNE